MNLNHHIHARGASRLPRTFLDALEAHGGSWGMGSTWHWDGWVETRQRCERLARAGVLLFDPNKDLYTLDTRVYLTDDKGWVLGKGA